MTLTAITRKQAAARFEVNFCMHNWPEKYTAWAIERIELNDGFQVQSPRVVVLAHSKDAPIWSLAKETEAAQP